MDPRSPVPEWFGRAEQAKAGRVAAPSTEAPRRRGTLGCFALLLGLGAAAFGVTYGVSQKQRADGAEQTLRDERLRRAEDQSRHEAQLREHAAMLEHAKTAAAPAPAVTTAQAAEPVEPSKGTRDLIQPIAQLRPKLRACYDNALKYAPDAEGRIDVTLAVLPSGAVKSVTLGTSGNLPPQVARCVEAVSKTARFAEGDSDDNVSFPVVFQSG